MTELALIAGGTFLVLAGAMPYIAIFKKVDDGVSLSIFVVGAALLALGVAALVAGVRAL